MELNTPYDYVHVNNGRERETQATALQEDTAYNINQRSLTQTDNEYSTDENTGYIKHNTAEDTNLSKVVSWTTKPTQRE